jgi:hypothetical protein
MSTFIFLGACLILAIIVMSRIPGIEHFVKPIIDLLFTGLKLILENAMAWTIFIFKNLWFSHADLARHLVFSADTIDPTVGLKEQIGK